jgi:hypothetical protein
MTVNVSTITSTPKFVKAVFYGRNGVGAVSVPGLEVGDAVFYGDPSGLYEGVISVSDEIQQITTHDYSAVERTIFLIRWL